WSKIQYRITLIDVDFQVGIIRIGLKIIDSGKCILGFHEIVMVPCIQIRIEKTISSGRRYKMVLVTIVITGSTNTTRDVFRISTKYGMVIISRCTIHRRIRSEEHTSELQSRENLV